MELDNIIDFFCDRKNVCKESLFGDTTRRAESLTRYMLWHYMHCELKISIGTLAKKFNRNRPSVFRGIRMIRDHMRLYKDVRSEYEMLVNELKKAPE